MKETIKILLFFIILTGSLNSLEDQSMKINLIGRDNGVGLSKDMKILSSELQKLGHITKTGIKARDLFLDADINIFIETFIRKCIPLAKKQYLLPNPEWFRNLKDIKRLDLILCRTKECQKIFSKYTSNLYYLGFSSVDLFNDSIKKDYSLLFHAKGNSLLKGSNYLLNLWKKRPDFPILSFHEINHFTAPLLTNIDYLQEYLPEMDYKEVQNMHGIHLCPSQSEGFGHSILEAMSCKNVVLTTDAPPMNEYIDDPTLKVETTSHEKKCLGLVFNLDEEDLENKVEALLNLSEEQLKKIGERNRHFFLKRQAEFRERLKLLFGDCS